MGLNFKGCDAQWSYSGFMEFRCRIWSLCNLPGDLRAIYYNKSDITLDVAKTHPLWDFFNHSDCDGQLSVNKFKKIIPALTVVLQKMKVQCEMYGKDYYKQDHDTQNLDLLIKHMEVCMKQNKPLIFC